MDEIFVHELQLPAKVKGLTVPDENGDFTIIINESLCPSAKSEAYIHELIHIKHDHFYKDAYVSAEEADANDFDNCAKIKRRLHKVRVN